MASECEWLPPGIDLDRPNAARVYDYLLGGACNFPQDREFGDRLLQTIPEAEGAARHNRAFLGRAVRFCVAQGIRQFLDLGSGIPTVGNVHQIAQALAPESRVVYVDHEPLAVAHSQLLLDGNDLADVVNADMITPEVVLNAAPVQRLINFDEPMAVLMVAVLHFLPDSVDPGTAVARYVDAMAPGSYLVISHGAQVELPRSQAGWRMFNQSSGALAGGRTREEVLRFMAGTELVEPGIVWTPEWRPDPGLEIDDPELAMVHAVVGRKP